VDNPLRSVAMAGAPSVIIPEIYSTASQTETNKFVPLFWSLRLWKSSSYFITFRLLSIDLFKKIKSFALSDT
jgi:hypothetical protein